MTYSAGGSGTEIDKIDFLLVGKENRKYLRGLKVIPGLQHKQDVRDLVKKKVKKRKKTIKEGSFGR